MYTRYVAHTLVYIRAGMQDAFTKVMHFATDSKSESLSKVPVDVGKLESN